MPVLVVGEVHARVMNLLVGHEMEHALAHACHTIVDAKHLTFDHRADDELQDLVECHLCLVEHLRDDDHRVMACIAHSECEVTCLTAHCRHHKPVAAGASVFIHRLQNLHACLFGRIITESRAALRQRKIVVDGLRHMNVLNMHVVLHQELGDTVCCRGGVIATDCHQKVHIVFHEEINVKLLVFRFVTAHLQRRAAHFHDLVSVNKVDINRPRIWFEQVFISLMESYNAETVV